MNAFSRLLNRLGTIAGRSQAASKPLGAGRKRRLCCRVQRLEQLEERTLLSIGGPDWPDSGAQSAGSAALVGVDFDYSWGASPANWTRTDGSGLLPLTLSNLIDETGAVIEGAAPEAFAHLPVLVGADAPSHAASLLGMLASEPDLGAKVVAAVRVQGRRWNLRLDNGVDVRLQVRDRTGTIRRKYRTGCSVPDADRRESPR